MTKVKNTDQSWDAIFYNKYATPQFNIATKALAEWNFIGSENVLDIGCGNGAITHLIANKLPNGTVTGIDLSEDMIKFAKEHFKAKNLSFEAMDASGFCFNDKFDLILSFYCLHWVKEQQKVFEKIYNYLKEKSHTVIYLMTDSINKEYSLTKFLKEVITSDRWKQYFQNYTLPWYFQTVESIQALFTKIGFNIMNIDLLEQKIVFPNKEASNLWLNAVPIAAQVPQALQYELMNDLTENYSKYVNVNDSKEVPFILPTIRIVATRK